MADPQPSARSLAGGTASPPETLTATGGWTWWPRIGAAIGGRTSRRALTFRSNFFTATSPVTASGIGVADVDGDGKEDVFLAQNFFGVDAETSRHDAGTGLLLLGDGRGGFRALGPREAGIAIYGEQRGCAVCDYDADGRMDLAVTQNGAETKLYRNREAKPGLRVRLHGPAGNPSGVGAELRLKFGQRFGPAREVHAGGGYWSQDSASEVLSTPEPPDEIWIRWAGGRVTTSVIPHAAKEILVDFDGRLAVRDPR